ncbi:ribonuclease P protein component [Sphingobacterium corticibacterium]|uniref:Ribonuclease P protein component n=1 Tax=Sphingobacterium corticibacterium TaxID=2484746 RepID=A0A4Q6XS93_9SPHI|nr:ribonuclease P protein component [Sphingobacterium corticibacterium]RZF59407.1 ribonuclease P protein component [Sphingobacterium corticibacterium]
MSYTFTKEERLCSKRLIESLFRNGSSFVVYPYRVVWLYTPPIQQNIIPAQSIISVSKRRFRKAVDRNALKRRIRETYRLQKSDLYKFLQEHSLHLLVAFQYVGKEKEPYAMLYQRMGKVLAKLKDEHIQILMGKTD